MTGSAAPAAARVPRRGWTGRRARPASSGVREWLKELRDLFGEPIAEQVVDRAAERGRSQALLVLDPASVTPSVALLQELLALRDGLPPDRLARLRRLVDRIVRALLRELTACLRPALAGSVVSRPTQRPAGPLDLCRTVARSPGTVRSGRMASPN